ncbi:MAG: hypothetical protein RIS35_121 [Pseudomonadota bacterium]
MRIRATTIRKTITSTDPSDGHAARPEATGGAPRGLTRHDADKMETRR